MRKLFVVFALVLLLSVSLTGCGMLVERPEIEEGRFNFSVTYEWNGEIATVTGVYVCEYLGTAWALDGGSYRDWDYYVEGDMTDTQLVIGDTEDGGELRLILDFCPEYFMSDPLVAEWEYPEIYLSVYHDDEEGLSILYGDDVEEEYNARIISYEYDEPIENSFGLFK